MSMVRHGGAPSSSSAAAAVPAPPSPRTLMLTMMTWYNTLTAGTESSGSATRRSSATTPMITGIPFVDTHMADLDSIVTFGAHVNKRVKEVLQDSRYCRWVLSSMHTETGRRCESHRPRVHSRPRRRPSPERCDERASHASSKECAPDATSFGSDAVYSGEQRQRAHPPGHRAAPRDFPERPVPIVNCSKQCATTSLCE